MIAICEECGKKYRVDTGKIKGKGGFFKCMACDHVITVLKPADIPAQPVPPPAIEDQDLTDTDFAEMEEIAAPEPGKKEKKSRRRKKAASGAEGKSKGLGIRSKMFLLLILIPIVMLVIAVPFAVRYINAAIDEIIHESSQAEIERAKNQINQSASSLAKQVEFYLLDHPNMTPQEVLNDRELKDIIFQQTMMAAEASLYLRFDPQNPSTFLISQNENLVGKPISSVMIKGMLGSSRYDEFGKIIRVGPGNEHREASDFYLTKDSEGNLKERILALSPVADTPYGVFLTADTDDFMLPVKLLEDRIRGLVGETRTIVVGIVGGTFLLIGIIVLLYGHRLTGKIRSLTDTTNRISVGELDAEIETTSKDEIGELAEAIARMQDSIRLSIERLRRHR